MSVLPAGPTDTFTACILMLAGMAASPPRTSSSRSAMPAASGTFGAAPIFFDRVTAEIAEIRTGDGQSSSARCPMPLGSTPTKARFSAGQGPGAIAEDCPAGDIVVTEAERHLARATELVATCD